VAGNTVLSAMSIH